MSDKSHPDYEKQIGDAVRSTFESGDFSHLKNVGNAVQGAVQTAFSPACGEENPPSKKKATSSKKTNPPLTKTELWIKNNQRTEKPFSKKAILSRKSYGTGGTVAGILGLLTFGLGLILLTTVAILTAMPAALYLPGAIVFFLFTALSGGLLAGSTGNRQLFKRLRQYAGFLTEKPVWTVDALSVATHLSPGRIRRDLRKGVDKHLLSDVQMDAGETCVIYGSENYRLYLDAEDARKQRELEQAEHAHLLADPQTAPLERFRSEGQASLQKLRMANNAVEDEVFSEKLSRLELTIGRIFSYVQAHPEKLPDTRKFMDYYLPTTLKLVEKYHHYEKEQLHMENILKAKADIRETLDTIDLAFNNLLQNLYHEDTLDVVTDMDVLHTMLEQEGLTEQKFDIQ